MSISVESGAIKKHNEGARIALTPLFEPRSLEPTRIQARALFSWVPTSAVPTGMHDGLMTEGIRGYISSFRSCTVSNCEGSCGGIVSGGGIQEACHGKFRLVVAKHRALLAWFSREAVLYGQERRIVSTESLQQCFPIKLFHKRTLFHCNTSEPYHPSTIESVFPCGHDSPG